MATILVVVSSDNNQSPEALRGWTMSALRGAALPTVLEGSAAGRAVYEMEISESAVKKILGKKLARTLTFEFGQFFPVRNITSTITVTVARKQ